MKQLDGQKFPKLMAYLSNPVGRRVRTNNHVERTYRAPFGSGMASGWWGNRTGKPVAQSPEA